VARTEHFSDDHPALGTFVSSGMISEVLTELMGEPATLFKEKINYKQPGGAGFAPHQDATAYRFVDHHVSVMVPIDPASMASGCLYFASGHEVGLMPTDDCGRVTEDHAATLDWQPVEAEPGDLVVFDSYAPHYSDTNHTDQPRRALYLTYNAASRGSFRSAYYEDKLAEFDREGATFGDERVRMSINDDFLGRPVEALR
jgi:ectoine hydroxylase-related dioxygenase (phytanoyl-CoA dioxygenase family)